MPKQRQQEREVGEFRPVSECLLNPNLAFLSVLAFLHNNKVTNSDYRSSYLKHRNQTFKAKRFEFVLLYIYIVFLIQLK